MDTANHNDTNPTSDGKHEETTSSCTSSSSGKQNTTDASSSSSSESNAVSSSTKLEEKPLPAKSDDAPRKAIPPKLSKQSKQSIHYTSLGSIPETLQDMRLNDRARTRSLIPGKKLVIKANGFSYTTERVVGNGSFGVVYQATVVGTGETVAIKKVLQDRKYKNRELQIMRLLGHPNVVTLLNSFYTNGDNSGDVYLNLVLEYVPETVYRVSRQYSKLRINMPYIYVKLYVYQLCRALAYIHSLGICHRDIKPQNLLIDPESCVLKLCDFGSAKILVRGEPNVSYICSRYYRAPELIFGATNYTTAIDIWSMGCVLAELLLGQPLFPGDSGVDQLVEIIRVLGTPSREEIMSMNRNYIDYNFPLIKGHAWQQVFRSDPPEEALDLIANLLVYRPSKRMAPMEACAHPFFDELRDPDCKLPNGRALPPLFNFSESELKNFEQLASKLIPPHAGSSSSTAAGSTTECNEQSSSTSSSSS